MSNSIFDKKIIEENHDIFMHRYAVSQFSPDYLDLQHNPEALTALITSDQFIHLTENPDQVKSSAEAYSLSPFQLQNLRSQYSNLTLYSYNITIKIPDSEKPKFVFVGAHNLAERVKGAHAKMGEYNGVFFPEGFFSHPEVIKDLVVYVSVINPDGTLGDAKLIEFKPQ